MLLYKIQQNLYYISLQKKAGNSNQDLIHAATLLFRDVSNHIALAKLFSSNIHFYNLKSLISIPKPPIDLETTNSKKIPTEMDMIFSYEFVKKTHPA